MNRYLTLAVLACLAFSCVPKDQYEALVIERNYYRNKTVVADSLADVKALKTYDQPSTANNLDQASLIRELNSVKATNMALNDSYQAMVNRYNDLLENNQKLLSANGQEVTGLQSNLAQRNDAISKKEVELLQLQKALEEREAAIARIETDITPAGQPSGYGRVAPAGSSSNLNRQQNASLKLNTLQSEVAQQLNYLPTGSYTINAVGSERIKVTLADGLVTTDGYVLSADGQLLLRRLAYTLAKYPSSEVFVIGHADGSDEDAQVAYEESTDKAILITQQMVGAGLNPGRVTAGGQGFYVPVMSSSTPQGQAANRRVEILIGVGQ
ncbi:OmpA family protein [Lewinella sp. 4G2]|uniref:OmpA family protein n=1 Tax=Lewinella sp. 4G2 TaxID=1803372 RepID=UPI0007B4B9B6|nr:OmpA family protein [Lewinella sp. 4G2]OAV44738.1 hypothetical protein A3850_009655 [Lewinella sp. 4G2]